MNIREIDQTNWVCYKFSTNSFYYGEVGLLDEHGVIHSKDNVEIAGDPKTKLVKHGFGIFIYQDQTGNQRYEGEWDKDQKSGKGTLYLKQGGKYSGQFKEGAYHDNGIFVWANGDCYDGRWKKGRFDGAGHFKRHDGTSLKGSFKNNYFIDGGILRNPFLSHVEFQQLKKRRKQITKQYEKNQKIRAGYFQRVNHTQFQSVITLINQSQSNNRVPLIVASEELNFTITDVTSNLESNGVNNSVIDLRNGFKLQGQDKYEYRIEVENRTQDLIKNGGTLILSLDDSNSVTIFDQLFYPEIKELYTSNGFNQSIWSPKDLRKPEVKSKIIGQNNVNESFAFAVWSKAKLSQNLSVETLSEKLQRRFESVLPYIKIDVIFIEKGNEQKISQNDS